MAPITSRGDAHSVRAELPLGAVMDEYLAILAEAPEVLDQFTFFV